MAIVAKRAGDFLELSLRQVDGAPLRAAHAHVTPIFIERHGAEEIQFILVPPGVRRVVERDRRHHAIHENEERQIIGAEEPLPMGEAIDVFLRRPAFPHIARLLRRPAGEASALHVNEQLRPGRPQHDEVEVLHRHIAEHGAARLIDGDVAQSLFLEEHFERRFVGIAAVHD